MLLCGHLLRRSLSKEGRCTSVGTWSTQAHASEGSPQINQWPVRSRSCGDLIRCLKQPSVFLMREELKWFLEIKDTGQAEPSIVWDSLSSNSRKKIISWRTHTKKEKQLSRMHLDKNSTGLEIQHKKKQCPKILNETKKTLHEINL